MLQTRRLVRFLQQRWLRHFWVSFVRLSKFCCTYDQLLVELLFATSAVDDADRKSVVLGKSVSVRVDLGGRRIIKKKTTYKNYLHTERRSPATLTRYKYR